MASADDKSFKHSAKDSQNLRASRRADRVQIRKTEKTMEAIKRRNAGAAAFEDAVNSEPSVAHTIEDLEEVYNGFFSENMELRINSSNSLRRLLSQADQVEDIISTVISLDLVPILVGYLDFDEVPTLQFEAAWCLTNIASGTDEDTMIVVKSGAVPKFVRLLTSANPEVSEQALWALGNIAGDSPPLRDMVIDLEITDTILSLLQPTAKITMTRTITWTLANFCRGRPAPNFARIKHIIPYLAQLLMMTDTQILIDSAWALSYLTDGDDEQIQDVINQNVVPRLIQLLNLGNHELQKPTLRTLGNIVTGTEAQTQAVLDHEPLPVFKALLSTPMEYIRKETCWAMSNIMAGTVEQLDLVRQSGIIPELIHIVDKDKAKVAREAAWAVANMICGGSDDQVHFLVRQGCIGPLVSILRTTKETKLIVIILDGIREILRLGVVERKPYDNLVEEAGGVPVIEGLQEHPSTKVFEKAANIIDEYFPECDDEYADDGEEEVDMNPRQDADGMLYQFDPSADYAPQGHFDL
eukprot:m.50873 g.50873  ORF g.50873 m.50873 type:complete len:526 (+) comp48180_c0_seq1:58-1635(+)